jgi:membrane protein DedA with SNARE-associated domain
MTTIQDLLAFFQDPTLAHSIWIYPLISLLVAIEGPVVILLFSTAASTGLVKPLPVFLFAALGNLSADLVWYSIGYRFKLEWIYRRFKWFRTRESTIERLKTGLHHNASRLLFLAKLTSGLVIPSLITAGLIRVPLRRWLPFVALAETMVTGSLVAVGYYAAVNILKVQQDLKYVFLGFTIVFVLLAFYLGQKALRKAVMEESVPGEDQTPSG